MLKNFFSKLNPREKTILYVAVIIVVAMLADRILFGPALDRISMIEDEIAAQTNSIERDLRFLQYKDAIIDESEAFGKYFQIQLGDDDDINAAFLRTLERLATTSEVNLVKSHPTESKTETYHTEYFANLDAEGTLNNIISFMHKINSTDDLLKIVRFNLTPKRGAPNEVNISMTVKKLIVTDENIQ